MANLFFTICNTLCETSQIYTTLWKNYRYDTHTHIYMSLMEKLPPEVKTRTAVTRDLHAHSNTICKVVQLRSLPSWSFEHLYATRYGLNHVISLFWPLQKQYTIHTLSQPKQSSFRSELLIIHWIRSKRYGHKQYSAKDEKKESRIVLRQHKRYTGINTIRVFDFCETSNFFPNLSDKSYPRSKKQIFSGMQLFHKSAEF